MKPNTPIEHGMLEPVFYSISRMLERASYYGLRALVVMYMVSDILQMDRTEAMRLFGWVSGLLLVSQVLGGVLGDLVIGNRYAVIVGGLFQAAGAFVLCIPTMYGLYGGLVLILLGSGLYGPNIISNFGKLYLKNTKLLDAGYTTFYLAVNVGSFLGVFIVGYIGNSYGYDFGFGMAGVLMLISLIPVLFTKNRVSTDSYRKDLPFASRVIKIAIALVVVSLFWGIYEIANIRVYALQSQFKVIPSLASLNQLWSSINVVFMIPLAILASVLWRYFYSSSFFKLMLGFVFGVISYGILFFIPSVATELHAAIFMISLLFLAVSEIHIAPIAFSVLTRYGNPKYLAILVSLAFIPTRLFAAFFSLFNDSFYKNPIVAVEFGLISMTIISIALIMYVLMGGKNKGRTVSK